MTFLGYLELAGNEVANNARTAAYAKQLLPRANILCDICPDFHLAVGDPVYESPLVDGAPWVDPVNSDTWRFAGLLLTGLAGITDSTRTAQVFSSTGDGGAVGRVRHDVKEIRATGLLLAADDCALDIGVDWLKSVLRGDECESEGCGGNELCFFTCCPPIREGTVDPASSPTEHPVGLGAGWQTSGGGTWVGGVLSGPVGSQATGPELEVPCDDIVFTWRFQPTEGTVVRASALDENGTTAAASSSVRLRRVNWALNPTFATSTTHWSPGTDVTLTEDSGRGILETTAPTGGQWVAATGQGATNGFGDEWSARAMVELSSEDRVWDNLVPNPAVQTLGGLSSPQELTLDDTTAFSGSRSARVTQDVDGLTTIGTLSAGEGAESQYWINVEPDQLYEVGVWVRPQVDAAATLSVRWLNSNGITLASEAASEEPVDAGTWERLTGAFTAPASAARMIINIQVDVVTGVADGRHFNADAFMVSPQSPLVDYFDGTYPDATWLGLQHSSPSRLIVPADPVDVSLGITIDGAQTLGSAETLTPGVPTEVAVSGATGAPGVVEVQLVGQSAVDAGTVIYLSEVLLERLPEAGPYFDASFPNADGIVYQWAGQPNASASRASRETLSLTVPSGEPTLRPALTLEEGDSAVVTSLTATYRDALDPVECATPYLRHMRDVTVIDGPNVIRRYPGCGIANVEFTLVAATPWVFQLLPSVLQIPGGEEIPSLVVAGGNCDLEPTPPLQDPDCELPPAPPRPPLISGCITPDPLTLYRRRGAKLSGDSMAIWQEAVPIVQLTSGGEAARQTRVRFWPNPLDRSSLGDLATCSFCADFYVTYIPPNAVFTIDTMVRRAWVETVEGGRQAATHLLRSSDGGPVDWPVLTCGTPYIVTVDTSPIDATVIASDISLAIRS